MVAIFCYDSQIQASHWPIFMTLNIFHSPPLAFSTLDSFNKISYHLQDENSLLLHLKREVSNMSQDSQSLHLSVVAKVET